MPSPPARTVVSTGPQSLGLTSGVQSVGAHESDLGARIRAERIALLFANTGAALTGNLLVAVLALVIVFPLAPAILSVSWFAVFMLIALVRGWMTRRYDRRSDDRRPSSGVWVRALMFILALQGTWWGVFCVLLMRYASPIQVGFAPFIIGGIVAAAVATLGSLRSAYLAFTVPMIVTLIGTLVWRGGNDALLMAGLSVAFEITMIVTVWQVSAIVSRNIDLRVQNEHLVGSLTATNEELSEVNRDLAREIEERKRAEARSDFLATHDVLTGLPNRRTQSDRFAQAAARVSRSGGLVAILFVDLDRFKQVNDALGHAAGDRLLCLVSERLRHALRSGDSVCRHGGDEFLVLVAEATGRATIVQVAERILEAVCAPIDLDGHSVRIGCSIGISLYPDDDDSFERLVVHADRALYRAKGQGGDVYRFFAPEPCLSKGSGLVSGGSETAV
ncbi:diguanylate cyclase domain-containing protein [Thiorhodococcus fuscus]|uniref:Diguanylate cyclase domain-containing protein n=1 Tax=Thiorhodococcus fuscus TaxID=527200 RepID=A0ABW4YAJ2_9GAMM